MGGTSPRKVLTLTRRNLLPLGLGVVDESLCRPQAGGEDGPDAGSSAGHRKLPFLSRRKGDAPCARVWDKVKSTWPL